MRFTIRDLLWLTLLSAVLVAWWVDRGRLKQEIDRLTPKEYAMFGWLSEAELMTKEVDDEPPPQPSIRTPNLPSK